MAFSDADVARMVASGGRQGREGEMTRAELHEAVEWLHQQVELGNDELVVAI
jgi:hypothetical protein